MKLLRLPRSKVRLREPLPWNVRDQSARLLLSRGHIVESGSLLGALLARGAFVDIEEARAIAHLEEMPEKERVKLSALKRPQNLFSLWEHSAQALRQRLGE